MEKRHFGLTPAIESRLDALLASLDYALPREGAKSPEAKKLSQAIQRLSDHYTSNPDAATPWSEPWAKAASLAYYFTLNFSRARAVAHEARRVGFFEGIDSIVDFGSGMGTAVHAFSEVIPARYLACDISTEALQFCEALGENKVETFRCSTPYEAYKRVPSAKTAMMASYSLTELTAFPKEWLDAEALIIIEPSTRDDGRRLQSWRSDLIGAGFRIWAPCTHEGPCPLLTQSEKDWCHDRIHFDPPKWWDAIEANLPMKNKTITFSYLLARKSAPPEWLRGKGRMVGDMLEEKGKTRQALCRSPEREFLSWFPQRLAKGETIELERYALVELEDGLEKRASEVRLKNSGQIRRLPE